MPVRSSVGLVPPSKKYSGKDPHKIMTKVENFEISFLVGSVPSPQSKVIYGASC